MVKLQASELADALSNILLYTNKQSLFISSKVRFEVDLGYLVVYASDDYVAIAQEVSLDDTTAEDEFVLSVDDVKLLQEFCKTNKKYQIVMKRKMHDILFFLEGDDENVESFTEYGITQHEQEIWDLASHLIYGKLEETSTSVFALRPERLAKLARIKTEKEAPIDFKTVLIEFDEIIRFKLGSKIRGVIKPVTRTKVNPIFLWE